MAKLAIAKTAGTLTKASGKKKSTKVPDKKARRGLTVKEWRRRREAKAFQSARRKWLKKQKETKRMEMEKEYQGLMTQVFDNQYFSAVGAGQLAQALVGPNAYAQPLPPLKEEVPKEEEAKPQFDCSSEATHDWAYKWDATFRQCRICGTNMWKLACWTDYRWRYKTRIDTRAYFYGDTERSLKLNERKLEGGINALWTKTPHLVRSLDIIPPEILNEPITIIGAGAIGSFTALSLNKMGFRNITVYDHDEVNPENTGTQLYGRVYTNGSNKVAALNQILARIDPEGRNEPLKVHQAQYVSQNLRGIVISAVDSMKARQQIWGAVVSHRKHVSWFVDARMGAEYALMYVMNPGVEKDVVTYGKTLYDDSEAVPERCTAKATVYTGMLIAGMIAKAIKDAMTDRPYIRIMNWDIANDRQQVWHGNQLDQPKAPPPPEKEPLPREAQAANG